MKRVRGYHHDCISDCYFCIAIRICYAPLWGYRVRYGDELMSALSYWNTNVDLDAGVHYGVISIHSVSDGLLDDIFMNGTDNVFETGLKEFKNGLEENLTDDEKEEQVQSWIDSYDNGGYTDISYSDGDYNLWMSETTIMIFKSPVVHNCRGCSPCYPNAGDCDSPDYHNGIPTYCLKDEDMREEI